MNFESSNEFNPNGDFTTLSRAPSMPIEDKDDIEPMDNVNFQRFVEIFQKLQTDVKEDKEPTDNRSKLSLLKKFMINLSNELENSLEKADNIVKDINLNKGFSFEDEIHFQFTMSNSSPYPPISGPQVDSYYLARLNSRFYKQCDIPDAYQIFEEIVKPDYSEYHSNGRIIISTESNKLNLKINPGQKNELLSYALGDRLPQPMKDILFPQQRSREISQNTTLNIVAFQEQKGESDCLELQIQQMGGYYQDTGIIQMDVFNPRDLESEQSSLPWAHSADYHAQYQYRTEDPS